MGKMDDLSTEIQPIYLGMPILKEVSANWLDGMVEYITSNPQFIMNGFIRSGIFSVIDGVVDMGSENEDSGTEHDLVISMTKLNSSPLLTHCTFFFLS